MARGDGETVLEVGDVVTILGRIDPKADGEFNMGWVEGEMDDCIGSTGVIKRRSTYEDDDGVMRYCYIIDDCTGWYWIANWLAVPSDREPVEVPEEDFNAVFE